MTTRSTQAGFTMIEVMIAMTLTAIAILGIMALYTTSMRASGFTRHQTEAAVLAEDKLELVRSMPSTSPPAGSPETNIGPLGTNTAGIYTRTWSEALDAAGPFYDITVTVTWFDNDSNTVPHSVVMHGRRN